MMGGGIQFMSIQQYLWKQLIYESMGVDDSFYKIAGKCFKQMFRLQKNEDGKF